MEKDQGNQKRKGEGNMYDKIMRENFQASLLPLIEKRLGYRFEKIESLTDKQPTTIVRETDAFLLIESSSKEEPKFILHLEFEIKDNPEMVYRMSEYHGIGLKKYKLPIKHFVIYLGESKPQMATELDAVQVFKGFELVNIKDFSPSTWIEQDEPAKVIMGILGNYQKKNAVLVLESIIAKLHRVCKNPAELKKYIEQLIIISRMRNLEKLTIKISKKMPISLDVTESYLYKLGAEKNAVQFSALQRLNKRLEEEKRKEIQAREAEFRARIEEEAKRKEEEAKRKEEEVKRKEEEVKRKEEEAKREKAEILLEAERREKEAIVLNTIQKMKASNLFSDDMISEILDIDKATYEEYLKKLEER